MMLVLRISVIRMQLSDPGFQTRVLGTLQSGNFDAKAAHIKETLPPVVARLRQLLSRSGVVEASRLMNVLLRAFTAFTELLSVVNSDNDSWYCHCYGLELLCQV
jgi:hypothetical protein